MSKKKNPAAMLAGIVAMVLGVAIIVIAALAVAGIIKIDRPAGSGKVENSTEESGSAVLVEEEKCRDLEWQTADAAPEDVTATVETEAGSFVLKLYPGAAADKFAELAEGDSFAAAPFATLAENMFVQCPALSAETFGGEQNELACIYGAVGFAMDGGEISDSLFIVTAKALSGMSSAYISEHGFSAERAALYTERGGMPEYEGKALIFGQVLSGFETLNSISSGKTNGYTGGYAAENPVKILSVTINRPAEEGGGSGIEP